MKKLITVLLILLVFIFIYAIISYLYPVSEIKGYIQPLTSSILYQVNKNGRVDYWANYSEDVFEKGTEGGTKFNNQKSMHKRMWLNVWEKARINAYVKSIKEIGNINDRAAQIGRGTIDLHCIIIDETRYYSISPGSFSNLFNKEVYILSMMMWGIRPQVCDEAFDSHSRIPEEWFAMNRLNYMKYINDEFARVEEIQQRILETYEKKLQEKR